MDENNLLIKDNHSRIIKPGDAHTGAFAVWELSHSEINIGRNVRLGPFQHIKLDNAVLRIDDNVSIGGYCTISARGNQENKVMINIGENVRIDDYCHFECSGNLDIGRSCHFWSGGYVAPFKGAFSIDEKVTFGQKVVIGGRGALTVKKYSMVGGLSVIITENHNYRDLERLVREQGFEAKGIYIGTDVWIGASATILDGSVIQDKAIIGAGSLVKEEEIQKNCVYYGVPLIKIRERAIGVNFDDK